MSAILPVMAKVSDKLYLMEWRRAKGLSQEALAEIIGYSRSTIAAAESRNYNSTVAFLAAFAEGVDAPSVASLFSHPEEHDPAFAELMDHFESIRNAADRKTLLQVARSFSEKERPGFEHD